MNQNRKALRFLSIAAVLLGASGCTAYRLTDTLARGERLDLALPEGSPTHVIVRATNHQDEVLHIDWSSEHLRGPDGLEVPLATIPATALGSIYPGGAVEYHLVPVHRYLPADRQEQRRNSLSDEVIPEDLFARYEQNYELSVLVMTCRNDDKPCFEEGRYAPGAWKISTVSGRVRRVK